MLHLGVGGQVAAVIGAPAFSALRLPGISGRKAAALCVEDTVPWLEARAAARRGG